MMLMVYNNWLNTTHVKIVLSMIPHIACPKLYNELYYEKNEQSIWEWKYSVFLCIDEKQRAEFIQIMYPS